MTYQLGGKILVPLDVSPTMEGVLPVAQGLARALEAQLLLFHALIPVRGALLVAYERVPSGEMATLTLQRITAYLESLAARVGEAGVPSEYQVAEISGADLALEEARSRLEEMIASHIVQRAEETDVGMVLLGSHSFADRVGGDYGGVVSRVLAQCSKPVLVVPAPLGSS